MITPIQLMYEKLTDDIYPIGYNTILRFNVILAGQGKDKTRYHYHKEYAYSTNKYINTNKLITLRRNFDFFLSIENMKADDKGNKEYIMITVQNILYVREQLNKVVQWFRDEKYKNLFVTVNQKELKILNRPDPIVIRNLPMDKFLEIEPIILAFEQGQMPGIRINLSSYSNYVDITIDKFMGLVYLINTINMYESAQLLINYLQRPDLGTNLNEFNSYNEIPDQPEDGMVECGANNRTVQSNKKSKSFFDKINDL